MGSKAEGVGGVSDSEYLILRTFFSNVHRPIRWGVRSNVIVLFATYESLF